MPAVFISHSSADGEIATAVKSWLVDRGFSNSFLDLDKDIGLLAGENWEQRLYQEVSRCHAIILVVTQAWLNSKWCFAEFSMARSLGKAVFPIVINPEDIDRIGPELGSIQMEHWTDEGRAHLAERLQSVAHEIARGHRYDPSRPPYPGFLSFEQQDAAVFFGRDPEIRQIMERLEARRVHGGARLLLIVGPSGSGKSSVVKAGVLPSVSLDKRKWIVLPPFRPGDAPMDRLAKSLAEATAAPGWKHLRDLLRTSPEAVLSELIDMLQVGASREATLLLSIDQFEETFALSDEPERAAFLRVLAAAGASTLPILIIASMRSDMVGEILKSSDFTLEHEVFTLGLLPPERLRQIITGPAEVAAIQLEDGLTERIISDTGATDALPLLAFALREMNDRFGGDQRLTILNYEALGDPASGLSPLENAIRRKAEETISTTSPTAEELEALREVFVSSLVRVNQDGVRLRRPARMDEIPVSAQRLVQSLTEARLLSTRGAGPDRIVEVAHEALFRVWPQLSDWLDAEQDFLISRRHIEVASGIWQAAPAEQKERALLSGLLLEKSRQWMLQNPGRLAAVRDFVLASIEKEDAEKARAKRSQWILTASALSAAVVFAVLGGVAALQWGRATAAAERAEQEAARAQANELTAAHATDQAEVRFSLALGAVAAGISREDPRLALYLAGEAIARMPSDAPGFYARSAIIDARKRLASNDPHLLGSPIPVGDALAIALSEDGSLLAVGDRSGRLTLLDLETKTPTAESLEAHKGGIQDIAFDASGQLLATVGSEGEVRLWRIQHGQFTSAQVVTRFPDIAWGVAFDPTGSLLAATSEAGEARVLEMMGDVPIEIARFHHNGDLLSVDFSNDGNAIVVGTGSGEIHSWSLASGENVFPEIEDVHTSDVWEILFSPSGDRFATASSDGSSALFAYPEGTYLGRTIPEAHRVHSVAYGNDGRILIGGNGDGSLVLSGIGEADHPEVHDHGPGHVGRISKIGIDGGGTLLASLGRDQTVRLWKLFDPVPLAETVEFGSSATAATISSDGKIIASAEKNGAVRAWTVQGAEVLSARSDEAEVWALAISADGRSLASADRSGNVRHWSFEDGSLLGEWQFGGEALWWLGFTPDGSNLLVAGEKGLALFDLASKSASPDWLLLDHRLTGAAISPGGDLVAASGAGGTVFLYDLTHRKPVQEISVLEDIAWSTAFSPDGRILAVGASDEVISLWRVDTGEKLADLGGHSGGATSLAFLSDATTLVALDRRGSLHIWDTVTSRRLTAPIKAHRRSSWRIAASTARNLFVTAGDDGMVKLWNILDPVRACKLGKTGFDAQRQLEYFGDRSGELACERHQGDAVR